MRNIKMIYFERYNNKYWNVVLIVQTVNKIFILK